MQLKSVNGRPVAINRKTGKPNPDVYTIKILHTGQITLHSINMYRNGSSEMYCSNIELKTILKINDNDNLPGFFQNNWLVIIYRELLHDIYL